MNGETIQMMIYAFWKCYKNKSTIKLNIYIPIVPLFTVAIEKDRASIH